MYILMCIGCIECGVSSAVVGTFDDEATAQTYGQRLNRSASWRENGQNSYEVFPLPTYHNAVAGEFMKWLL